MNNVEKHKEICNYLTNLYAKKNHDYGDSVHDTFLKYGLTSFLVRMEDKLNRARTLNMTDALVNDEKITDTLLDLANYAIISVIELNNSEDKAVENDINMDSILAKHIPFIPEVYTNDEINDMNKKIIENINDGVKAALKNKPNFTKIVPSKTSLKILQNKYEEESGNDERS